MGFDADADSLGSYGERMFHERLLKQLSRSLWTYRWRKLEVSKVWNDGGDVHIILQSPTNVNCDSPVQDEPPVLAAAITAREAEEQLFVEPRAQRWA